MKKVKKQLAHLFDATQCINCGACTTACAQTNYPDLINEFIPAWNTVCNNIRQVKVEKNRPMQLLVQCQQCSEAPCVTTCPFGANYYDENGLVRNDPKRCIGCNYCVASLPSSLASFQGAFSSIYLLARSMTLKISSSPFCSWSLSISAS